MAAPTPRRREYEVVGNYELIRPLGEGGSARVFLARHCESGAEAVLKRIHQEHANDPAVRRIFQSEVRALMGFRHPNAVALLDASRDDEPQPYVVMEYIHGVTLHEVLESDGRLTPEQVGAVLGPLCLVLAAAHAQDLMHRDLTPANLMIVGPGTPRQTIKLMDFGLARIGGFYIGIERLTGDGSSIGNGTPDYLCPEQIRGEPVDARGDLYSVGVMIYRALCGFLPFQGAETVRDILLAHRDLAPPRFADFGVTDVPPPIEALVRSCLAKSPAERPQSARELAHAYGAALGQAIVDDQAFAAQEATGAAEPEADPWDGTLIDRFAACLPEQIAALKLRGFVDGVGGTVLESLPGLIRIRIPGATAPVKPAGKGLLGWFRGGTSAVAVVSDAIIELHLRKVPTAGRSLVDIAVVRPDREGEAPSQREAGLNHCKTVSHELRAYLMIGR
jgi:tRNA A-37 threonylcarbamoyl transferase component Bud32